MQTLLEPQMDTAASALKRAPRRLFPTCNLHTAANVYSPACFHETAYLP